MTYRRSNRLLIIDGSNLLFQMFFGIPARIAGKNGKPTNKFGTLENVIANTEKIEKKSVKESIIRNSERLKNNYKIIRTCSHRNGAWIFEQILLRTRQNFAGLLSQVKKF